MGLLDLFGRRDNKQYVEQPQIEEGPTQEQYEQFMLGWRIGFPLRGQPPATIPDRDNPEFQRGLDAGKAEFERAGSPDIPYE